MGTWTQNTGTGVWTHSGATRGSRVSSSDQPALSAFVVTVASINDAVAVRVLASADLATAWEVLLDATNVVIRPVVFNVPEATAASSPHFLSSATQPYTVDIRPLGTTIQVFLNGATTPIVTYDTAGRFSQYRKYGFTTTTSGARVLEARISQLEAQVANREDVLVAVCLGNTFRSTGGTLMTPIASGQGAFAATSDVAMVEYKQLALAVDGSSARVVNLANQTVDKWIPTAGSLPGQTTEGTTRATILEVFGSRVALAGDPQDPQNVTLSATDDHLDLDTGSDLTGAAFALGVSRYGKVGQPVTALRSTSKGTLAIGCVSSCWELVGDPANGQSRLNQLSIGSGVSGKDSMAPVSEGVVLAHSPDGVLLWPEGASPINLTNSVLTAGIQIDRASIAQYIVIVIRDPARHGAHVFLTPRDTTVAGLHFWYDERVGGYERGRGGMFPQVLPLGMEPTSACVWRGDVILGCRDGYLRRFDDAAKNDDGTAIDCVIPMSLIRTPSLTADALLEELVVFPGIASDDVDYKVYGGSTPEEAYVGANRWLLARGTIDGAVDAGVGGLGRPIRQKVRAPSMVIELSNGASTTRSIVLEAAQVRYRPGMLTTRRRKNDAYAPPAPCTIAGESSSTPDITPTPGPGGGGPSPPTPPSGGTVPFVDDLTFFEEAPDDDFAFFGDPRMALAATPEGGDPLGDYGEGPVDGLGGGKKVGDA